MHDARAIANRILDLFDSVENSISNKKINKLVYYCHAFSLVRLGRPLIKNHVEAWKHGPVVRVVYEAFKDFEFRPIIGRASAFNFANGVDETVGDNTIPDEAIDLISRVVGYYVKFTADELEDLSHVHNGPWAQIWNLPEDQRGFRSRIPDQLISEYFSGKFADSSTTH